MDRETGRAGEPSALRDIWALRQAAAVTLTTAEEQLARQLRAATPDQVLELLDAFAPTCSLGPEWTRGLDLVIEHVWAWCTDDTLAAAEANMRARGPAWTGVANAMSARNGAHVRRLLARHFAQARLPSFAIA